MQNDTTKGGLPALVFNGQVIHDRNEMLSLTDMWRAAKAEKSRQPSEWLASADGTRFLDALGTILKPGISGFEMVKTVRGGRQPGTWAHWQVALAYAKYLSPEFHMWCNEVVRARMEGLPHQVGLTDEDRGVVGGIVRSVARAAIGDLVPELVREAVEAVMAEKRAVPALDFAETVSAHQAIAMAGIAVEDRQRGTAQMVTNRLIAFCARRQVACLRTPAVLNPAEPYRFPYGIVCEWLMGEPKGLELIRNQIDRAKARKARKGRGSGQGALSLVPPAHPAV